MNFPILLYWSKKVQKVTTWLYFVKEAINGILSAMNFMALVAFESWDWNNDTWNESIIY